ncbi:MAG TPA: protein kinase [Asanoa sp.]
MLTAGDLVGDRYRLANRIAGGGMGEVWRATDEVLGRTVAVKILHTRAIAHPGFGARFRHEARTMAALHHPGVVDVYDYGEADESADAPVAYLVMAHVDGQPLSEKITAAGRLDATETMAVVAQTARALQGAHAAGVVHRDVKPGNLLVRPDGTVMLVDFGVARSADATALTGVNEVVGTALYMAPEQVAKRPITPATDVYALGAVAYHCLAGHPPFVGDNPLTVALRHLDEEPPPLPDDVPPRVRALVMRALQKEPQDRFPSAAVMASEAQAVLGRRRTNGRPADGDLTTVLPTENWRGGMPVAGGPAPSDTFPTTGAGDTAPVAGAATGLGPELASSRTPTAGESTLDGGATAGAGGRTARRRRLAVVVAAVVVGVAAIAVILALTDPLGGGTGRDASPSPTPGASQPAAESRSGARPTTGRAGPAVVPGGSRSAPAGGGATPSSQPTGAPPTRPAPSTGPTGGATPGPTPPPTGEPTGVVPTDVIPPPPAGNQG